MVRRGKGGGGKGGKRKGRDGDGRLSNLCPLLKGDVGLSPENFSLKCVAV